MEDVEGGYWGRCKDGWIDGTDGNMGYTQQLTLAHGRDFCKCGGYGGVSYRVFFFVLGLWEGWDIIL